MQVNLCGFQPIENLKAWLFKSGYCLIEVTINTGITVPVQHIISCYTQTHTHTRAH